MNGLDFAILGAVGWFTFTSLTAGLIREVMNLVGLFAGVYLAGRYYLLITETLGLGKLIEPPWDSVTAFASVFLLTVVVAHLLSTLLHRALDILFLGWLDRVGGALFGFAKGLVIAGVAVTVAARFSLPPLQEAVEGSVLAPLFFSYLPLLLGLLPPEFEVIRQFLT